MKSSNSKTGGVTPRQLVAKHGSDKGLELTTLAAALEYATPETLAKIESLLSGGGSDIIAKGN